MLQTLQIKKFFPSVFYIVLLLNITLNQNAFSATWKNISKNESGEYSFDQESILGSTNNKEISIKVNILKDPKEGDKSRLLRYLINCSTSTLLLNEVKRYSESELKGVETVFKVNATETIPKPNTLGQRYIDIACGTSSNNSSNASTPTTPSIQNNNTNTSTASPPPSQLKFTHVNKFNANEIRSRLLQTTWNTEAYEIFQFNYSFLYSIYRNMRTQGGAYDYLQVPHRNAFMPHFNAIEKNMRDMDKFIENIALSINVQPKLVYQAFGIEAEDDGSLKENIQKITNGRLTSDKYWRRFPIGPNSGGSVNEWYDARDPQILFGKYYPQLISEFNSEIPKLMATAKVYEEAQIKVAQQRDDRQKWLQTAEGKKYLVDEEVKRKKDEDDRLKAKALEESRIAKEFPYVARFTCTTNGFPVNFISCLYGSNGVNTEIEIKNGQEYKLYQGAEFSNIFPDDNGAKVVNLRSNYSIVAQNASSNLILGVKIVDRKTGATVLEKQVSKFGAIKFRN